MRRTALLTALSALSAALLTLAACAPSTPAPPTADEPVPPTTDQPDPPAADPPATPAPISGFAEAKRAWEANGPASYAYTLTMSCLCIHRGSYAVEVRDGSLASVRDAASGQPSPESRMEWIVTVDRLLEVMEMASQLGTPVRATFDPGLGYPIEAEIGVLADDSGTLYRIENLRPL
ncbi:MAG TPA: DUF6174 domain-containing protein [Longimicrobiaceae bacterium]|nr:DUF6174 domain-containing protein [Longimicrobiaceae bacterium]